MKLAIKWPSLVQQKLDSGENFGIIILALEMGVAIVVYVLIAVLTTPLTLGSNTLTWETLFALSAMIYIILSVRLWDVVPADKIGVRLILGIPTDTVSAGPPVIPPLVGDIELFPTAVAQREFPDEPENIFRATKDGDQNAPAGKTPPLRINFSDSLKAEDMDQTLGPLSRFPEDGGLQWVWRPGVDSATRAAIKAGSVSFDAMTDVRIIRFNPTVPKDGLATARITAEVAHISRLRIHNAVALVKAIAPEREGMTRLDEVFRQIEDEQTIALNSILTKISVAQAQANIDWLNAILFARVEARIQAVAGHSESWGIDLEGAALKPFGFNRSLNDAITGVAEASFAAQKTVTDAEAARKKLILEGEGAAKAAGDLVKAELKGRGDGLAAAAKATGLEPVAILAADVAKGIGEGSGNVIIGEDGLGKLVGAGAAIANALPKKP